MMVGKGLNKKSMVYVGNVVAFIDFVPIALRDIRFIITSANLI